MKRFTFVFIGLLFVIAIIGSLASPCFAEVKEIYFTDNDGLIYSRAIFSDADTGKYYDESYVYGLEKGLPRIATEGYRYRFNSFDEYDNIESIFETADENEMADYIDAKKYKTFMKACYNILKKYGYIRMDFLNNYYVVEYFRVGENSVIERMWVAKKDN